MDTREPLRMSPPHSSGIMASGGSTFGAGVTNNSNNSIGVPNSAGMSPGMRLSFNPINPTASKPMDTTTSLFHSDGAPGMRQGGMFTMSGDQLKKKRGRPRKYGPDGNMALALSPSSAGSGFPDGPSSDPMGKKRGRPLGSAKKQQLEALGAAGIAFTPHIITVQAGEDVASKIMSFSQQGARTICILSANGAINNVTLRQPATSGGTVTYEGRFEIISLSGSFLLTEDGTTRSRTGGLSVSLAGSDGRVLGGGVAGMLLAATPVQLVVASFIAEGKKPKPELVKREQPLSAPQPIAACSAFGAATVTGATMTGSPPSEGTSSESSEDPSPMHQHHNGGHFKTSNPHIHSTFPTVDWVHSANQMRHDSEIKMMPN